MAVPWVGGNVMFLPPKSIPGSKQRPELPSAGWSQTPPAEAQLSVVWEGAGVRLSSSQSWHRDTCQSKAFTGPCSPVMPQGMLPLL